MKPHHSESKDDKHTNKTQRRRKQNRIAQQAFRARQKVRVEALETEWAQLRQLHEALNHATVARQKEIEALHSRVEELLQDIEFLKSSQELERGWPSPSTTSSASSSYAPSAYTHSGSRDSRYGPASDPQHYRAGQFDLAAYFHKGAMVEFPEFPLREGWMNQSAR
jgi:polyhydroxyalkanoate synthesis regulator phasin